LVYIFEKLLWGLKADAHRSAVIKLMHGTGMFKFLLPHQSGNRNQPAQNTLLACTPQCRRRQSIDGFMKRDDNGCIEQSNGY